MKIQNNLIVAKGAITIRYCNKVTFNKTFWNNRNVTNKNCSVSYTFDFDTKIDNSADSKLVTFGPITEEKEDNSRSTLKTTLLIVILILTIIISLLSIFPDEGSRREREMIQVAQEVSQL